MSNPWLSFGLTFVLGAVASVAAFGAGTILATKVRVLEKMGVRMHRTKLWALEHVWPLTLFQKAWKLQSVAIGTALLAPMILLKSAGCLVLGIAAAAWLPLAMLILPALFLQVEGSQEPLGRKWIHRVIGLQGGSHLVAAAAGTAIQFAAGFRLEELLPQASAHLPLLIVSSLISAGLGIAAGWAESYTHIRLRLMEKEFAGLL